MMTQSLPAGRQRMRIGLIGGASGDAAPIQRAASPSTLSALAGLLVLLVGGCSDRRDQTTACAGADWIGREILVSAGPASRDGGEFEPEEAFLEDGEVGAFAIDATEVTNSQFAAFVTETRYVTTAERHGPDGVRLGGAVFDRRTFSWRIDPAADWRHPLGAGSNIEGRENEPVVQVSFEDAQAYARWAGRRLPKELEWERAARLGANAPLDRDAEAYDANGVPVANTWQGAFPVADEGRDGYRGLAPVGCFAPNATGLYDMTGNAWEWTIDWYGETHTPVDEIDARRRDAEGIAKRVIKGGSHLCAPNFCARYRTRSRQGADPGLGTSHIGFRTVRDVSG